jgi:tetratricopeptide (TPR) repeat protein
MATIQRPLNLHARATELYAQGKLAEAAQALSEAIGENETSEIWNDWAAVQARMGQFVDSERGFRRALEMNSKDKQAVENLGALLYSRKRWAEAKSLLMEALVTTEETRRTELQAMIQKCEEERESEVGRRAESEIKRIEVGQRVTLAGSRREGIDAEESYENWFASVFGKRVAAPGVRLACSWPEDSEWGRRTHLALVQVECAYVQELLGEIKAQEIPGDIVEFGIFEGWWIDFLWNATENIGLKRRVYGFDSFEGLSEPDPKHDLDFWKKGQYACSFEQVEKNVQALTRPRIKLVKGFFEKSLRGADAVLAEQFCYVRIDCDIYQPALDCLRYLGPRLADGAILVFDDWPHLRGFGEQRAFEEWLPEVPHLEFEFLFYGAIGHFYIRVHHKAKVEK